MKPVAATQKGAVDVFFGKTFSSEDKYGEFIENQPEFSLFTPIKTGRYWQIGSGLSYLNKHKDIAEYEYNLTQLVVPLRCDVRVPVTPKIQVYAGLQGGLSILVETYEKTETYTGFGTGAYIGGTYQLSAHYRLIAEYEKFNVTYFRIDNLDTNLQVFRVGVGYLF